jgi:hypothetical protein
VYVPAESVDSLSGSPSPSWASTLSVLPMARGRALDEEGSDGTVSTFLFFASELGLVTFRVRLFVLGAIVRVGGGKETDLGSCRCTSLWQHHYSCNRGDGQATRRGGSVRHATIDVDHELSEYKPLSSNLNLRLRLPDDILTSRSSHWSLRSQYVQLESAIPGSASSTYTGSHSRLCSKETRQEVDQCGWIL